MSDKILIISELLANFEELKNKLSQQYYNVFTTNNVKEALKIIDAYDLDIVLLDIDAITLLSGIKSKIKVSDLPVMLISLEMQQNNYIKIMEVLDNIDHLTGAHDRSYFNSKIIKLYKEARENDADLSLVMMDMDFFREINNTQGHLAGDEVLKQVVQIIKSTIRSSDLLARFGGEEFALLFCNADAYASAIIIDRLSKLILNNLNVTASFGITSLLRDDSIEVFINRADQALYKAKRDGRNKVSIL
jgi:diguanylate cyclase (GGDEF)-like protein